MLPPNGNCEVVIMNNITTDHLIKEYLEDCRNRLSPCTVKNHKTSIQALKTFLGKKEIINAKMIEIRQFLNDLKCRGRAQSTINNRLASLRSFFKYIKTYHHMPIPDLAEIDINDYPKSTWEGSGTDAISRNGIRALIEAPDNIRDTLIIAISYYSGLRANELSKLKLENIDTEKRIIKVIGKGNKPRIVPYSKKLDRIIYLWIHKERKSYVNSDSPYFFPSKHSNYLHTHTIHRIVHHAAKKAGIQKIVGRRADGKPIYKVHTHILRHSHATHASEDEIPLNHIQHMMGHSHISTTLRYAGETSIFKTYYNKFKGIS